MEESKNKIIIKSNIPLPAKDLKNLYDSILHQYEEHNVILIPSFCEVYNVPSRPKGEWKPFVYDYDPSAGENHTRPPREGEEPHWEEYWAQEFICSVCGRKNHMANYCPHCGADMRKEGQP